MQNIYDNEQFYSGYEKLRQTKSGLNEVVEQPALRSLLPSLKGLDVLDIGCGFGDFCRYASSSGARRVVGVDPSQKMLAVAQKLSGPGECYQSGSFENLDVYGEFDLVVSSLVLHYVKDIRDAFSRTAKTLKTGGMFVFSIEHPIATCGLGGKGGWQKNKDGQKQIWQVTDYSAEGIRQSHWFVDGVIKYHRTVSTIINELTGCGFRLEGVLEPHASNQDEIKRPRLVEERVRPPFLLIRAVLEKHSKQKI